MRTGRGGEIILVHAITADADCADENPIAIKSECSRKNRDPVRQIGVRRATVL